MFDGGLSTQVALKYAIQLKDALSEYDQIHGRDLPIRLRMVLVLGDVEMVGDQYLSQAFSEAQRFLDHKGYKDHLTRSGEIAGLVMSALFHTQWISDPARRDETLSVPDFPWAAFQFFDKHRQLHNGYVLGGGWEQEPEPEEASPAPFRVTILVAHSLEEPLPEAVELVKAAANAWRASDLLVEVRVDTASRANLKREAARGCDLLIFYGHGLEDGRLRFTDGAFGVDQLGLDEFFRGLSGFLVFACFGARFAAALPCPWAAFSESIIRHALLGFMAALVRVLGRSSLEDAIERAVSICREHPGSSYLDHLKTSDISMLPVRLAEGKALFTRLSPILENRFMMERPGGRVAFSEHDPFVGRLDMLRKLLSIPTPYGGVKRQRLFWVHGDAGMGKTALLRQFAINVRDLMFYEHEEPVNLFQMNCWGFTDPADLLKEMVGRLRRFYGTDQETETLEEVFRALERKPGQRHVWILDDLTYLSPKPDDSEKAANLLERILDGARTSAVCLQLVASARRPGPGKWPMLQVGPMTQAEADQLAFAILHRKGEQQDLVLSMADSSFEGARRIFQFVHGSTALYKRSLRLAVDNGTGFWEYAEKLAGDLGPEADILNKEAGEMARFEKDQLSLLAPEHGFIYATFLEICYPLMAKAGWCTLDELLDWFGDRFHYRGRAEDPDITYGRGLKYLVDLNFLSTREDPGQDVRYVIPPNQRQPLFALQDPAARLPESIEPRGIRERLSLAMERARVFGLEALADFDEMERDYRRHINESPEAAGAVFQAMNVRAEVMIHFDNGKEALPIYDEIVVQYDGCRSAFPEDEIIAAEQVAKALVNKGVALGQQGRADEARQVLERALTTYGDRQDILNGSYRSHVGKIIRLLPKNRGMPRHVPTIRFKQKFGDGILTFQDRRFRDFHVYCREDATEPP